MARSDSVFIFIGTYPDEAAARADYDVVKDLHERVRSAPTTRPSLPRTAQERCTSTRTRWPPGTGRGAGRLSARSSASYSRRPSSPPRWSARPWAGSAAICGAARPGPTSRSSASSSTTGRPLSSSSARASWQELVDKANLKAEKRIAKELDVSPRDVDKAVQAAATEYPDRGPARAAASPRRGDGRAREARPFTEFCAAAIDTGAPSARSVHRVAVTVQPSLCSHAADDGAGPATCCPVAGQNRSWARR